MGTRTFTLTANGTYSLGTMQRRWPDAYIGEVDISGTFGSGAIAINKSNDGGSTQIPMQDQTGVAYTTTVASTFIVNGAGGTDLYAVLTGATSPSIKIVVND